MRPRPEVLSRAIAAAVLIQLTAFGTLYFLTIPDGPWLPVLVFHIVGNALFAYAAIRYHRVGIWLSDFGLAERGFLGARTIIPIETIASAVSAPTYYGGGTETRRQLFVCDADGRQILRMRGQYWSNDAMDRVAGHCDVPLHEVTNSVTIQDLLEDHPGLLYWFERRPRITALIFSAGLLVTGGVLYLILSLVGVTFSS